MRALRINRPCLAGLIAAAVLISGAGCSSDSDTQEFKNDDIGVGVSVTSKKAPDDLKAVVDSSAQPKQAFLAGLTPVLRLTGGSSSKLPADATLRFKLSTKAEAGDTVLVASSESATGPWTDFKPATVDEKGLTATITTNHLSWWQVVKVNVNDALKVLNDELLSGLTSGLTTSASAPQCQDEDKAKSDGYSISSSAKATLHWCFGIEGGQRVLKITSRVRYPLEVSHPGFKVVDAGRFQLKLEQLARAGSGNKTILPAFGTAIYTPDIKPGQKARIDTAYSGWAQSLGQLEAGISIAAAMLTRFGAGGGTIAHVKWGGGITKTGFDETAAIVDDLLTRKDCLDAFLEVNAGQIIKGCFNPAKIMDVFGWQGLLIAPVMAVGTAATYFQSAFDAVSAQFNGKAEYRITVRRAEPASTLLRKFVSPAWEFSCGDAEIHVRLESDFTGQITSTYSTQVDGQFSDVTDSASVRLIVVDGQPLLEYTTGNEAHRKGDRQTIELKEGGSELYIGGGDLALYRHRSDYC